ncbi:MAG: SusC/RagA family TonB-linked outer membrane protein, partial [Polaribacter sp.]
HTPLVLTDSLNPAFNNNLDFQNLFYRNAVSKKYNFSIKGGTEVSNYRISLGIDDNEGVVKGTGIKRYTLSTNNSSRISKNFTDQIITRFTYTDNKTGLGNPRRGSYDFNNNLPFSPANLYSSLFNLSDNDLKSLKGALEDKLNTDRSFSTTISNIAKYTLFNDLTINSQLSFVYSNNKKNYYEPSTLRESLGNGFANYASYQRINVSSDTYLSYDKKIGKNHKITAILGNKVDYNQYETMKVNAIGFGSDAIKVINGRYTKDEIGGSTNITANALVTYFGSLSYTYKNRYRLNGYYSIDGSSRFGEDVRWAKFPSLSAAWTISEEPFMKSTGISNFVNYLKIRGSWGINGKQFGKNYVRFGAYSLGYGGQAYYSHLVNVSSYAGITGVIPNYNSIANSKLSWEESTQWDMGVDLDLFNHRLNFSFDAYHKQTDQLYFNVKLPAYSGYNTGGANVAGVLNYGWESSIKYHVFPRTNDLRLELILNFSKNENFVTKLPNDSRDFIGSNYGYVVGKPLNVYKLFITDYILDDISQLPVNPFTGESLKGQSAWGKIRPGFPISKDLNGDYLLNEEGDFKLSYDYSPTPDIQGAFNINLKYKSWYLQAYSQFSFGSDIFNTVLQKYTNNYDGNSSYRWFQNGVPNLNVNSFWQKPGDGAAGVRYPALYPSIPGLNPFYSFKKEQTLWLESGDYWRITNVSLGYNFKQKANGFMKNLGISNLRVYSVVLNPYQWQRSKAVVDASLVNAKGRTLGNGYPRATTVTFGMNIKF